MGYRKKRAWPHLGLLGSSSLRALGMAQFGMPLCVLLVHSLIFLQLCMHSNARTTGAECPKATPSRKSTHCSCIVQSYPGLAGNSLGHKKEQQSSVRT